MTDKVWVVGIGAEGRSSLTVRAREIVDSAELLVGAERLLAMIPESRAERLVTGAGLDDLLGRIEAALGTRTVVVLASGDPGFFGIARLLVSRLGRDGVEIVPNVSSVQLAFARIKESWEDAAFLSVHGRSLEGLAPAVQRSEKVAILTGGTNTPAAVARCLLASAVGEYDAYLCENLGRCDERVRALDLAAMAQVESSPLSVVVLLKRECSKPGAQGEAVARGEPGIWPLGIPDEDFYQRRPQRGLITKLEVRMASLAKLGLREESVVWDVGAGSGAVAIEAGRIARRGEVYAVERDPEDVELIRRNVAKFEAGNVRVIHGTAPAALEGLPDPDAVFLGGSGGQLPALLEVIDRRLRAGGRVVANAATLETAGAAMAGLRARGFAVEASLVQVSRSKELAGLTHFEALNPVFIVGGRRGAGATDRDL